MSAGPIQPIRAGSVGNVWPLHGVFNVNAIDARSLVTGTRFADALSERANWVAAIAAIGELDSEVTWRL